MADASDSKSDDSNIVWVQVPPPAPLLSPHSRGDFYFPFILCVFLYRLPENFHSLFYISFSTAMNTLCRTGNGQMKNNHFCFIISIKN